MPRASELKKGFAIESSGKTLLIKISKSPLRAVAAAQKSINCVVLILQQVDALMSALNPTT